MNGSTQHLLIPSVGITQCGFVGGPAVSRAVVTPSDPVADTPLLPIIWLFYGASGVAKTTAAHVVPLRFPSSVVALSKVSTRRRRGSDQTGLCDVAGVAEDAFARLAATGDVYAYRYGGYWYGLQRSGLTNALQRYRNVTAVMGSVLIIKQIREEFRTARVIAIALTAREDLIIKRLQAAGCTHDEIATRVARSQQILDELAREHDAFDYVIENNGTQAALEHRIMTLFAQHNDVMDRHAVEVAA